LALTILAIGRGETSESIQRKKDGFAEARNKAITITAERTIPSCFFKKAHATVEIKPRIAIEIPARAKGFGCAKVCRVSTSIETTPNKVQGISEIIAKPMVFQYFLFPTSRASHFAVRKPNIGTAGSM